MKKVTQVFFLIIAAAFFYTASFAQEKRIVAMPIEGSKPFIMTGRDFEKLESPASLDRFEKIDNKQKEQRLKIFANIVSKENQTLEYVILLRAKTKSELSKNINFVQQYLTKTEKIKSDRISFVIDKDGEERTELWLVPNKRVWLPTCMECPLIQAEDKTKLKDYLAN